MEHTLQSAFASKRIRGEWFNLFFVWQYVFIRLRI